MAIKGSLLTNLGKKILINRGYTATPDYTIPTKFAVGVDSNTPNISDIDLTNRIPISNGDIIDDGSVIFTGENSGTNSTSGTTTYKEGAGTTDATSQNMIGSGTTSTSKTWILSTLNQNMSGTTPSGFWLYIKDDTAFNKLATSGTAIEGRYGSGTFNYFVKGFTASTSGTGWNWMTTGTALQALNEVGTVETGTMGTFSLDITTNNTTDTFVAGDIIYDLLRQWDDDEHGTKNWLSGTYPNVNESTLIVEMRGELNTTEANGFDIDSFGDFNTDSPKKMAGTDVFTSESKSSTDKFTFICQDRLE